MKGLKFLRVFGIPIEIHWSWFIIFGLITYHLGLWFSKYETGLISWIIAGLTSLIFFGSLLFHELAHSFVALKQKIAVKKITLLIFGGLAQLTKTSETPKKEVVLAMAGPLSSLFLAGVFFFFNWLAVENNWQVILMAPLFWLFWMNLVLSIFNSLPLYPLDGGRVFQAIIWHFKKDWFSSLKIAYKVTNLFCWIGMILSIFLVFFKAMSIFNALWLLMIILFINMMAKASYHQALIFNIFGDLKVKELMIFWNQLDADIKAFCHPEDKIVDILPKFQEFKTWEILVQDEDKIIGKISFQDINNYLKEKLQKTRA